MMHIQINKIRVSILIIVFAYPLLPYLISILTKNYGLIWLFMEQIYYFPVSSIFGEYFFYKTEIGFRPEIMGRFITGIIYLLIVLLFFKIRDFQSLKKKK